MDGAAELLGALRGFTRALDGLGPGCLAGLRGYSLDLRYNETHDEAGRFASGDGSGAPLPYETVAVTGLLRGQERQITINPSNGDMARMLRSANPGLRELRVIVVGPNLAVAEAGSTTHSDMAHGLAGVSHPVVAGVDPVALVADKHNKFTLITGSTVRPGEGIYKIGVFPAAVLNGEFNLAQPSEIPPALSRVLLPNPHP